MKKIIVLMVLLLFSCFCSGNYETANDLFQAKNYNEAIPLLKQFIEENPEDVSVQPAILQLAGCYRKTGQHTLAIPLFMQFMEDYPTYENIDPVGLRLAGCYRKTKQYDLAIPLLEKFIEENPDHARIDENTIKLADCRRLMKKYGSATILYNKVLTKDPEHEGVDTTLVKLSGCYYYTGQNAKMLETCDKYLSTYSSQNHTPMMTQRKAEALQGLGDEAEAQHYFDEVVYLYPNSKAANEIVQKDIAGYLQSGNYDAVLACLLPLSFEKAESCYLYATTVEDLIRKNILGEDTEYLSFYRRMVDEFPEHRGSVYAAKRLLDESINTDINGVIKYGTFLLDKQESLYLYSLLADAYEKTFQIQKAVGMLQLYILKAHPSHPDLPSIMEKLSIINPTGMVSDMALRRLTGGCLWVYCVPVYEGMNFSCMKNDSVYNCNVVCRTGQGCSSEPCGECNFGCFCRNCDRYCSGPPNSEKPCYDRMKACAQQTHCSCDVYMCSCEPIWPADPMSPRYCSPVLLGPGLCNEPTIPESEGYHYCG